MNNEYIDFKFGSYWASEFHLVVVSSSDRYSPPMFGNIDSNIVSVVGKRGVYKYPTQIKEKIFTIKIAYDNVPVEYISIIQKWLDPTKVQKLTFSDEPFKFYYACLNSDPEFTYLPFLDGYTQVGSDYYQNGVIKGEGTLTFVCIDNYGYSEFSNFSNNNPISVDNESEAEYAESITELTNYINLSTMQNLNVGDIANLNWEDEGLNLEEASISYEDKFDIAARALDSLYNRSTFNAAHNSPTTEADGHLIYKPWVKMSGLVNGEEAYQNFYKSLDIVTSSTTYPIWPMIGRLFFDNVFQCSDWTALSSGEDFEGLSDFSGFTLHLWTETASEENPGWQVFDGNNSTSGLVSASDHSFILTIGQDVMITKFKVIAGEQTNDVFNIYAGDTLIWSGSISTEGTDITISAPIRTPIYRFNWTTSSHLVKEIQVVEYATGGGSADLHLLNSGSEKANLTISMDLPILNSGKVININIAPLYLEQQSSTYVPYNRIGWGFFGPGTTLQIGYFGNYKPYTDFITAHPQGVFKLLIDGELGEILVIDTNTNDKVNLSRFNLGQNTLQLETNNFIDYTKPFPENRYTLLLKDTALRRTRFNRLTMTSTDDTITYFANVNLNWKHTYL